MKKYYFLALFGFICVASGAATAYVTARAFPQKAISLLGANETPSSQNDSFTKLLEDQQDLWRKFNDSFAEDFFHLDPILSFLNRPQIVESAEIAQKEDDRFLYFEIKLEGVDSQSLQTHVENGLLTISGDVKKSIKSDNNNQAMQSFFQSSFSRTFPLPENVNSERMEIINESNKIVLKLPKITPS